MLSCVPLGGGVEVPVCGSVLSLRGLLPYTTHPRWDTFVIINSGIKATAGGYLQSAVVGVAALFLENKRCNDISWDRCGWNRCLNCATHFHCYFAWIGKVEYGHFAKCSLHSGPILFRRTFQGSEGCSRNHRREGTSHIRGGFE